MERRCVEPSSPISARFICWQRSISRRVMCSANRRSTTKRTKPKPPWNCSKGWSFKAASSPATRCSANARSVRRSSTAAATISSSLKTTNPRCEPTSLLTFSQPFPPYTEQQRQKHLDTARVKNKGHGRLEEREVQLSTRIVPHLNWPGLAQVCRCVQTTVRKGKRTVGIDYAITSLGRYEASARWVAQCLCDHWGIENRLHFTSATSHSARTPAASETTPLRKSSPPAAIPPSACSAPGAAKTSPPPYATTPTIPGNSSPNSASSRSDSPCG